MGNGSPINDKHGFFKNDLSKSNGNPLHFYNTVRDGESFPKPNDKNFLPPKNPKNKNRGRNGPSVPSNTFGVSRDEREKVLAYKIVAPPTGLYNVKFNICDPKEKVTKLVPNGSSPERDPRFDYSKTNTLLWLP